MGSWECRAREVSEALRCGLAPQFGSVSSCGMRLKNCNSCIVFFCCICFVPTCLCVVRGSDWFGEEGDGEALALE